MTTRQRIWIKTPKKVHFSGDRGGQWDQAGVEGGTLLMSLDAEYPVLVDSCLLSVAVQQLVVTTR